jgi:hypothetical protein
MAPGGELHVTYVRGDEELPAIVPDPGEDTWRPRLPRERHKVLKWEVALIESGCRPFLFDSAETARAWAMAKIERLQWWFLDPPRAQDFAEDDEDAGMQIDEATERYRLWAEGQGLDPESPETVRRAHEASVISSLCLYQLAGCSQTNYKVVEQSIGNVPGVVGWAPKSYTAPKTTAKFYEQTFGWQANKPGKSSNVYGDQCQTPAHLVQSLEVKS